MFRGDVLFSVSTLSSMRRGRGSATCAMIAGVAALMMVSVPFSPALSDENIKVPSGVAKAFGPIYVYTKKNCEVMPPSSYSVSQPKHGKATVFTRKAKLGVNSKCPGATGYMLYFTYQSNKGYRGKDSFRLSYSFERYVSTMSAMRTETIYVQVR